jgi:phosphohistidine phosphatase
MARWLARRPAPDQVLCSSARRTRETLAALLPELSRDCEVRFERALYLASPERICDELRAVPENRRRVLVVGHNPGMQRLAALLAESSGGRGAELLAEGFPTAAVAHLRLGSRSWAELDRKPAELVDFVRPRDLGDAPD